MHNTKLTTILLFFLSASVYGQNDSNLEQGKEYFEICQSCHGENAQGNQTTGAPRLSGQYDWYLIRQLTIFRADIRGAHEKDTYGQSMSAMSKMLPDDQAVRDVVAHIGTLSADKPLRTAFSGSADEGKNTFQYCASCHGEQGQGRETPGAPRLAGQHDWYIIRQLNNFLDGIRGKHKDDKRGAMMRGLANTLITDDQKLKDVVAYITTLE